MLRQYGDDAQSSDIYLDAFLNAFPMLVDEVEPLPYTTAEDEIRDFYRLRALERFLSFMGLAQLQKIPGEEIYSRTFQIRKLPLMDQVVRFSVGG